MAQYLESLLGEQGFKIAWWVGAFVITLLAAVLLLRILRSLMGTRLNMSERGSARGRAPRLGVTEYFNLDKQGRRLVIVRRDNIEHLVLIGGPNDVLIESNILRGERALPRADARDAGKAEAEIPMLEVAPPPRPVSPPAPEPRIATPTVVPMTPVANPRQSADARQPVAEIPREDLAMRLEEVLRKPIPPRTPEMAPVASPAPMAAEAPPMRAVPTPRSMSTPQAPPPPVTVVPAPMSGPGVRPDPVSMDRLADALKPITQATNPTTPAPAVELPISNRVEPVMTTPPPVQNMPMASAPKPEMREMMVSAPEISVTPPTEEPARVEPAQNAAAKNPFDSLEEEMARLLGRGPSDKP